ncbi:hypothetical protein QTL86_03580 [Cellulosilyticum sp. ST5]|uniref:hypothetical protein n=1 Tax=Cellulosilyticum sp. ST5 TaxID=3055805 RepID=UPI0039773ADC
MEKTKKATMKIAICSSIAVAFFTIFFVVALITTFDFGTWEGIESYAKKFQPINLLTVIPSILLAVSFLIFNVSVHYLASADKKIWSHLAMNFGLVYSTISLANYLIQLITVMPSIMSGSLNGLEKMVSGYPNSIFYALMGSYFFMCISLFFEGLLYKKQIRIFLFLSSIICVLSFIIGAMLSISIFMILGAICWITGTVGGMLMISIFYINELKQNTL